MWAGRLASAGQLELTKTRRLEEKDVGPGQALLRVTAGGICGSDHPKFMFGAARGYGSSSDWLGPVGYPLHEVVGEVTFSRSSSLHAGVDHVVGWAGRSAGLAEFAVVNDFEVLPFKTMSAPDVVIAQPLACVLYALGRVRLSGRSVAILGMGPIGAMFGHAARTLGADHVIGIDPTDRTWLIDQGCVDEFIVSRASNWARSIEKSSAPNLVIEAVGHQTETLNDAILGCATGGTILYFGIPDQNIYPIDMEGLMRRDLTLVGGITRNRRTALATALRYMDTHSELARALITHRFERNAIQEAYVTSMSSMSSRLKVVLDLDSRKIA